jgi:hypothetical protein
MKLYFPILILLMVASSCNQPRQEQRQIENPAKEEIKKPDGVIIEKQTGPDSLKGSLKAYASTRVDGATITITYHSPAVRGRIIWGGLVPFDQVWVTGAHMATTFECDYDFVFGDRTIPAGKYALFTIPGKDTWTVIMNSNWQQHLTDAYDSSDDAGRMTITPRVVEENQERLQYAIRVHNTTEASIIFRWERLELSIPVRIINPEFD